MSIYIIPAVVALLLKVGAYILAKKSLASPVFLGLLAIFALHNTLEIVMIFAHHYEFFLPLLLKFYYVVTVSILFYLCVFVMTVGSNTSHKVFNFIAIAFASVLSLIILFSNVVIAGAASIGYSATAIKGGGYFIFQGAVLGGFLFLVSVLVRRFSLSHDVRVRLKCFYVFFALSPIVAASIVVLVAMQFGFKFNAVGLFPLASSCFLLLVVLSEKNHDLINIRQYLLFSKAHLAEKKIIEVTREHLRNGMDLPQAKLEFEKALVQYALDDSDGNIAWAADRLSVNRSSLYSMLNRLDIPRDDGVTTK